MAYCSKCGTMLSEGATFCVNCGQPQSATERPASATPTAPPAAVAASGLSENVAGLLCYVVGWITGIIFFLIDKRPSVRFHAAQSIVVFGALHILSLVLGMMFGASFIFGALTGLSLGWILLNLIHIATLVLWVVLMVTAYQGKQLKVPIAAGVAESIAGKQI